MPTPIKIRIKPEAEEFLKTFSTIKTDGENTIFELNIVLKSFGEGIFEEVKKRIRYFYVSYNGVNPVDNKSVIGHLAFNHQGFPSMLYICEQLIPGRSKCPIKDIVLLAFNEFTSESDFDEFILGYDMNDVIKDILGE